MAFIRSANIVWSVGRTTRSWAAITNQLGLFRQAGVEIAALRATMECRTLRGRKHGLLGVGQVRREVLANSGRRELQEAELVLFQVLKEWWGIGTRKNERRFPLCRCERRNVDQASDFRVVPGLGDHGSAVRMSDKQEPPVYARDRSLHGGNVVRL